MNMTVPNSILRKSKYGAAAAAAAAATPLNEPLIPNKHSRLTRLTDDDDDDSLSSLENDDDARPPPPPPSDDKPLPPLSGRDLASALATALLVTGGLAASAAAAIAVPSAAVILMAGICMANSPVVANKQLGIAKSAGVRASVNSIRKEIDFLKDEVNFLAHSVENLQAEADMVAGFEQALRDIAVTQGANVDEIVEMVKENESILKEMKANLKRSFVTAMTMVVVRADKDGDMKIDAREIPLLALRLQIQLDPYGIRLDTSTFDSMIREDNDIANVLKFCGDLLFEDEKNASGDDDGSVDSEATFDFETFCKNLDKEEDAGASPTRMTYEEKAGMAIVDERHSKGSVEVARGGRMTISSKASFSRKHERKQTIVKEVKRRQTKLMGGRQGGKRAVGRTFTPEMVMVRGTSAEF